MQPISHQAHDGYDPGYPQNTIDRLIKMELEEGIELIKNSKPYTLVKKI